MAICALGYLGIRSDKTNDWRKLSCDMLGLQEVDKGAKTVAFRMDDHKQRFIVTDEGGDELAFIGWEVESKDDLSHYAEKLCNAGYKVQAGSTQLADQRCVEQLIVFNDPDNNRIELFCNPLLASDTFKPGRPISGFKTGPVGMGHAVLHAKNIDALVPFYQDFLGFSLSDFGLQPIPMYFFHVNERHHSFAIIGSGQSGFHHFMIEYNNLDDVGQGYDIAQLQDNGIAYTLGRHTNDYMTSFYANTPSGFFIESGWGGRLIKPDEWEACETTGGPSFWGHDRLHLPDNARQKFKDMRMNLAKQGIRTPLVIDCPWLYNELWNAK